ncbi:MAG: 4'-phosphopantetheinyl transferase superfamily protein [Pirellulaceae bacterium]
MTLKYPKKIELTLGEVQVWQFSLERPEAELAELESLLSRDEIDRANRFFTSELRSRFIVARGTLRRILAIWTGANARELSFHYGSWGKPRLSTKLDAHGDRQFNLSHSADQAVVALSREAVGVDLEVANPRTNHRAIASQILSPQESETWAKLGKATLDVEIMRLWVSKESFLKAVGLGIAEGLQSIDFPLPIATNESFSLNRIDGALQMHLDEEASCGRNSWLDPKSWRVDILESGPQRYLGLCCARSEKDIQCFALE